MTKKKKKTDLMTAFLKLSDSWDEFKEVFIKSMDEEGVPKAQQPLNDFDAALKGVLSVPAPKKNK